MFLLDRLVGAIEEGAASHTQSVLLLQLNYYDAKPWQYIPSFFTRFIPSSVVSIALIIKWCTETKLLALAAVVQLKAPG